MHQSDCQRRVSYFYNGQVGQFKYQRDHPMQPKRITMAHNLIVNYRVYHDLDVYMSREAKASEILAYHDPEYVKYLSSFVSEKSYRILRTIKQLDVDPASLGVEYISSHVVSEPTMPCNMPYKEHYQEIALPNPFNVGNHIDSPFFPGIYTFSQLSTGASIDCAHLIMNEQADIAINWSGGLHHAKKCSASGFCYINDIVICILELLKAYPRVLYIDIDVHHGDGVEEAFLCTNRQYCKPTNSVMTVSFHQFGEGFFPGTGSIDCVGEEQGRYHAINVPLKPGIQDESFVQLFKSIIAKVMEVYRPSVIVLQSGADSLARDKLGDFNLSIAGHGSCVEYIKSIGVPMILLGGGGYTVENVARCWAYETGLCVGKRLSGPIPSDDLFYESYRPDHQLHYTINKQMNDQNNPEDIRQIVRKVSMYLKEVESAPSVPFHYLPNQNETPEVKPVHKKQYYLID